MGSLSGYFDRCLDEHPPLAVLETINESPPTSLPDSLRHDSGRVEGFRPSTCGFYFGNSPSSVPYMSIEVDLPDPAGTVSIPIGNAANGMCGGMAFAARDYFEAGISPWSRTFDDFDRPPRNSPIADTFPEQGSPLFDYLSDRLFASFDTPAGPTKFMKWMWPDIRDTEPSGVPDWVTSDQNRSAFMQQEYQTIKSYIDNNALCPLGLVQTKSRNPSDMGNNHQVLAYGYDEWGGDDCSREVSIHIYDPNNDGDERDKHDPHPDSVRLSFNQVDPENWPEPRYNQSSPIHAFFVLDYRSPANSPGPWSSPPTDW